MNDDASRKFDVLPFIPAVPPLDDFYEMQQHMLRANLSASAEFTRRSMEALQAGPAGFFPSAPTQMLGFFTDCMKLSLSPMTLFAASSLSPMTKMMQYVVPPDLQATRNKG